MPIRPIDLQTVAALTREVERIQSLLQQRPTSQQQQFAAQFRHDIDGKQTHVNASPKSEDTEISRDKEGASPEHEDPRERKQRKKDSGKTYIDDDEDHKIDVRI